MTVYIGAHENNMITIYEIQSGFHGLKIGTHFNSNLRNSK